MPMVMFAGSGSTSTKFVGIRAPSSRSTIATTKGASSRKAGVGARWTIAKVCSVPFPLARIHDVLRKSSEGICPGDKNKPVCNRRNGATTAHETWPSPNNNQIHPATQEWASYTVAASLLMLLLRGIAPWTICPPTPQTRGEDCLVRPLVYCQYDSACRGKCPAGAVGQINLTVWHLPFATLPA